MTAIELIKSKIFQDGPEQIEALKETNLTINKGEFVAVIGPSGSGKSTFLTIIGGLQSPHKVKSDSMVNHLARKRKER